MEISGYGLISPSERYALDKLERLGFHILFVDGNHENFDRLYGDEFPVVDFHGGKAHKIRKNVFHLMRGYVFELCGKRFFAFGGARSHDIDDGILDEDDYPSRREFLRVYDKWERAGKHFRINHSSWWIQEMPSEEEKDLAIRNLESCGNTVDYIITHCGPQQAVSVYSNGCFKPDELTDWFNHLSETVKFERWYFGHYHDNVRILGKYEMLYDMIERIV